MLLLWEPHRYWHFGRINRARAQGALKARQTITFNMPSRTCFHVLLVERIWANTTDTMTYGVVQYATAGYVIQRTRMAHNVIEDTCIHLGTTEYELRHEHKRNQQGIPGLSRIQKIDCAWFPKFILLHSPFVLQIWFPQGFRGFAHLYRGCKEN